MNIYTLHQPRYFRFVFLAFSRAWELRIPRMLGSRIPNIFKGQWLCWL